MLNILRLISIILIAVIGIASVNIIPASATHENDHRFTVYGRVLDDQGSASSKTMVVVKDNKDKVLGSAKTDSNGSYKILLHIHNEDFGREVLIVANKIEKKFKITFDTSNKSTERMATVNFGVSEETGKGPNQTVIIGAITFVVLAIGAYFVYSGRKKKEQQQNKTVKKQKPKKLKKLKKILLRE